MAPFNAPFVAGQKEGKEGRSFELYEVIKVAYREEFKAGDV